MEQVEGNEAVHVDEINCGGEQDLGFEAIEKDVKNVSTTTMEVGHSTKNNAELKSAGKVGGGTLEDKDNEITITLSVGMVKNTILRNGGSNTDQHRLMERAVERDRLLSKPESARSNWEMHDAIEGVDETAKLKGVR
jgi:hypothetical protein